MSKLHSLLVAVLATCAVAANAGSLAELSIINRTTGERLQTWERDGRLYVAGRPGDRYAVELMNHSRGRVLAVLSVDGINAITGETAAGNQSGYVLSPQQRAEIVGWRKSMEDVAAFYFTALPDSYAGRTGRPQNVGVIGVAVYREYSEPPVARKAPPRIFEYESAANAAASSQAPEAKPSGSGELSDKSEVARSRRDERLATGHGERVASSTQYTDFRRASDQPAMVMTVYYDSYANLVAQGVIAGPRKPKAFPGGFVPDPGC
jgi:hypothetical protein